MLWQRNAVGALEVVTTALQSVSTDASSVTATAVSSLKGLLGKLRLKCLASIIVEDNCTDSIDTTISEESKDRSRVTPLLPAKTLRVLNSILSRNQSKVRVKVQPNSAHAIGGKSAAKTAAEGVQRVSSGISKVQLTLTTGLKSDGSEKGSSLPPPQKSNHSTTTAAMGAAGTSTSSTTTAATTTTSTSTSAKEKSKSKPTAAVSAAFVKLKLLSLEYEKVKNRNHGTMEDLVLQAEQFKLLEASIEVFCLLQ
jgi:hypothetical protein